MLEAENGPDADALSDRAGFVRLIVHIHWTLEVIPRFDAMRCRRLGGNDLLVAPF